MERGRDCQLLKSHSSLNSTIADNAFSAPERISISMKWQITSPQSLHMRVWDNEAVAYDAVSGTTHLLGLAAARVLEKLKEAPGDAASLAQALIDQAPDRASDEAHAKLEAILAELAGISLITPATP
jgi:PqqD family protein of HPr-rel-A system